MNVRTLCLALLSFGDHTGYDIRKKLSEGAYSHFADASYGSIYPALAKLEADGAVCSREESISGRPVRKVYSITDDGAAEFRASLLEPAGRDVFKSPFFLIALCAEMVDADTLNRAVDRQLAFMREELDGLRAEASESPLLGAGWVVRCAEHCIGAQIEFVSAHRDELIALALQDAEPMLDAAE